MRRLGLGLAAAFALLAAMPAWADNCSDMRANIAAMDAKSSGLPGYLDLRLTLSLLYSKLCRRTAAREGESWYDIDGKKLGPATGDRPEGAAYTATDEVAKSCADSGNPSMCAMIRGSVAMCANPPEGEAKRACVVAGGYPTGQPLEEDVDAPA